MSGLGFKLRSVLWEASSLRTVPRLLSSKVVPSLVLALSNTWSDSTNRLKQGLIDHTTTQIFWEVMLALSVQILESDVLV